MNPILEIFSQGEEIVTGQTVDSNAAWLSEQAAQMGFSITRHTAVGDKLADLTDLLREIAARADCCLCTGGLGPTCDDLTAEAVAQAFNLPLAFDAVAFAQIQQFFNNRNRPMSAANRKQAMLPQGAERLDNHWGTAPGFALRHGRCWFAFMPGVPYEMRHMFLKKIHPQLFSRFALKAGQLISIKTFGIGESDIQQRLNGIAIPPPVKLGFRAGVDEVQTKLLFPADFSEPAMAELTFSIADRLGDAVFGIDGLRQTAGSLAAVVDGLMMAAGKTLAVAETASHGLLAAKCLGSSWLLSAVYEQSLSALGVRFAVSVDTGNLPATGAGLANALQQQSAADFVLIQLHKGGQEQFQDKDCSIVLYNTLLFRNDRQESRHTLTGPAGRKQNQAALSGLDVLRRYLQHKEL
jgi:competence/damage-inducible protein CinA-like protein